MLKDKKPNASPVKKPSKKELLAEATRQRALVREVIFPLLLKHAKSVKQAQNICKTITVGLDAVFMQEVQEYTKYRSGDKLSTLKLTDFMNSGVQYEGEWALIEALQGEKIQDAKGLIEGMEKEIQRLVDKELINRSLDTLETEWL